MSTLREIRKATGLTLRPASLVIGCSFGRLSEWERGVRTPTIPTAKCIARAYLEYGMVDPEMVQEWLLQVEDRRNALRWGRLVVKRKRLRAELRRLDAEIKELGG